MSVNKKIKAAEEAIKYIKNNMKIGLGTGSTADEFTKLLSIKVKEGLDVVCVPTSESTEELANELGIILGSLNEIKNLDLTVDGADEIDGDLSLIKGGGGALLREKIIAYNSNKMIVIADDSKKVKKLGNFKLPVEVVCFEHEATNYQILKKLEEIFDKKNLIFFDIRNSILSFFNFFIIFLLETAINLAPFFLASSINL